MRFFAAVRKTWVLLAMALGAAGGAFYFLPRSIYASASAVADTLQWVSPEPFVPTFFRDLDASHACLSSQEVQRHQRFSDLLQPYTVAPRVRQQLQLLPPTRFDFRKVAAGKKYTVVHSHDSLRVAQALIYEPNEVDYVIFYLRDSLYVEHCQRAVSVVEKEVSGVIEYTLSHTMEALGVRPDLTNKFVDVLGWKVDFQRLHKGDRFKLVYDERQVEGRTVAIDRIRLIEFEHGGRPLRAFYFDRGEQPDYFDEEGNSLRKALLRYPIEFTRISSHYNPNRFHPIAKEFRPHLGTDFAAPTGTPIRSVGDGIIEEAQFKALNGNYVKVRHNATYTTGYLHMSRIATGIRPGVRVTQGQVIGYVGSTGLSTGPHLCYRFYRHGVQVDAMKVELPSAHPVAPEHREAYAAWMERGRARLACLAYPTPEPEVMVATR